jgi:hypothetical protein
MDLQGRLKGPDGIVFMGLGYPEKGQHSVPQQSVDKTLVLATISLIPAKTCPVISFTCSGSSFSVMAV